MEMQDWKSFSVVLLVLIAFLAGGLLVLLNKPFDFSLEEKSVVFYSNGFPVEAGLEAFSKHSSFLVESDFLETSAINSYMANAMNLFSVVFVGNQKKTT